MVKSRSGRFSGSGPLSAAARVFCGSIHANGDGAVTITDALFIAQMLAGMRDTSYNSIL